MTKIAQLTESQLERARSVKCVTDHCLASPGQPCVSAFGKVGWTWVHANRRWYALHQPPTEIATVLGNAEVVIPKEVGSAEPRLFANRSVCDEFDSIRAHGMGVDLGY